MQGLEGEHVKYLIDGVPVIGRQNGNIDLNQINLQNVDHVETIQGPMSVVYGSNALAGVINIITKPSDRYPVSVFADAYYETVGVYDFSFGGSYAKNKNSFSLNGNRYFFDGYTPSGSDTTRWKQWKPKLQWNADGAYTYRSAKSMLKFSGTYFYEKIQDKGNALEAFNYDKAFDKYHITNRYVIRGEWNQNFSPTSILNVMSAYSFYSKIKNTYLKDLTSNDQILVAQDDAQDTTKFSNIILRAVYNHILKNNFFAYQIGVDLSHESAYGKRIQDSTQAIGDYAAFLSMNFTPWSVLAIQPGLRYIYNTNYKAPLVYSLNIKWNIAEPLTMRVSAAKGFRAPSLKELYLNFDDVNHTIYGNPNLEAESSQNYNLSLNYNHQTAAAYNWGIELALFYNKINDKIELEQVTADQAYSYINVDEFYTQGFELMFNNRIYPWLKLNLGYALTGRKQVDATIVSEPIFIYSSDFTTQINYWWQLPDINFSVFYKYNGAYPNLAVNSDGDTEVVTMDAYNSLDANLNKWFLKRTLNIQFGAKNIFNNTNVNTSGSGNTGGAHSGGGTSVPVNWGRTFFVKLQYNFSK
jgi:outer membrane receptor for ferrienterochelin and colicins